MRKIRFHFFLAIAALLLCCPAWAQSVHQARTVDTLRQACEFDDRVNHMRCVAYLAGVADSMDFLESYEQVNGKALRRVKLSVQPFAFCHDQPWTGDMLRQAFLQWADAHPDKAQEDQYIAVVDAFHDAMPCR